MVNKITTPITQTGVITKINELIGSSIVVDSVISSSSENPVQNKIIYQALTAKADATVIPTKTSDLINDSHFIQTINVNGTAQSVSTSTVDLTIPTTAADIGALPDTTTIGAGFTTFKVNGTTVGTIGANQTTNSTIDMTVTASVTVDQTYNASSTYPQSGTAVAQAISSTSLTATYTSVTETLSLFIS